MQESYTPSHSTRDPSSLEAPCSPRCARPRKLPGGVRASVPLGLRPVRAHHSGDVQRMPDPDALAPAHAQDRTFAYEQRQKKKRKTRTGGPGGGGGVHHHHEQTDNTGPRKFKRGVFGWRKEGVLKV